MGFDEDQNTQDGSQATLNSFTQARNRAVVSARPPLWLNLSAATAVAISTLLMFYDNESEVRRAFAIAAALLYWATWVTYRHLLRKRGIKVRVFPRSWAGNMFGLGQAVFFILVIIVAAAFFDRGVQSAPYLAALINGFLWAIVMHRFPTGEWTRAERRS